MQKLHKHVSTKATPQSEPIPGSAQVANNAGGFSFKVDQWKQLDRFLVLGTEGGTYYVGEKKLTQNNAASVMKCIKDDGIRVVNRVVEISDAGRAPKNDPALFVLAMASKLGDEPTRKAAYAALPKVARIGTHLFHFAQFREAFGGWGRGMVRAVRKWYSDKPADRLAYDVLKYQSRDGWAHRDLLRLTHVQPVDDGHQAVYQYVVKGALGADAKSVPAIIEGFTKVMALPKDKSGVKDAVKLIDKYGLTREMVPTEFQSFPEIWEVLLADMPITALIRNLATMTRVGLLTPLSETIGQVTKKIKDAEILKKGRVHPIAVLAAMRTYQQGHGMRGTNTWTPVPKIVDALDDAFYKTFQFVEPTNKRILIGLDVSGSMTSGDVGGVPGLSPRVASAALCMVTARTEENHHIMAFTNTFVPFPVSPRQRLDDVVNAADGLDFGATDCSQPMIWAKQHKVPVDAFIVYTDSETWEGNIHPPQALTAYRDAMGIPAKMIVVGMTSTGFTIADPNDAGSLDVAGFDTAVPNVIADFIRN